jgi:hypothetical protein
MEPRRPNHTALVTPRPQPGRQPRRKNFRMSEPTLEVGLNGEVEFEAPNDSRMVLLFLDAERVGAANKCAPFGMEVLDLAAGERRTLRVECGQRGEEYRYAVYLVDHDDLADGNSVPRIRIAE